MLQLNYRIAQESLFYQYFSNVLRIREAPVRSKIACKVVLRARLGAQSTVEMAAVVVAAVAAMLGVELAHDCCPPNPGHRRRRCKQ